jgi:hypothetical protein
MVLAGKTLSPAGHRRAADERATTHALRVVTMPACQNGSWARPTVLGLMLKCWPSTVRRFFFDFCLLFQKIVENLKMRRKYHTTQKNTKQISIESLRVGLHIEIYLTLFYSIMQCIKLQELKY